MDIPEKEKITLLSILTKYIQYIKEIEGTDYILNHEDTALNRLIFTNEEWNILKNIAFNTNP